MIVILPTHRQLNLAARSCRQSATTATGMSRPAIVQASLLDLWTGLVVDGRSLLEGALPTTATTTNRWLEYEILLRLVLLFVR